MKVIGLITEYNPFHNGHKYHIQKTKEMTNADYIIVVMSGNFVQRGTPAIIDKYTRAKFALENGADIVFELPVCYATASAEFFAKGACTLLDKLGIINNICFGSECGNIFLLEEMANIFIDEPKEFKSLLKTYLKEGISYPLARQKAIIKFLDKKDNDNNILISSNNILGIEYIKALKLLKSNIKPITLKREGNDYNSEFLSNSFSSASSIRKVISNNKNLDILASHIPQNVLNTFKKYYNKTFPIFEDDCSNLLNYKLLYENEQSLQNYFDISDRIISYILKYELQTFSQKVMSIKTKNLTLSRINRSLIHILLNITKNDINNYLENDVINYVRLLGLKKEASFLLKMIKNFNKINVITKMADAYKILQKTDLDMLNKDIFASNIYNQIVFNKFNSIMLDEYKSNIIII